MVIGEVISHEGLTSVLVYSLQNFIRRRITEAGEEGDEALEDGVGGVGLEDDGVQLRGGGYARLVGHEALGGGVDGVEDDEFGDACAAWIHTWLGYGLCIRFRLIVYLRQ